MQAYKEHEQKEALDAAIQKLYVSRIVAKVFARTCETVKTLVSIVQSYIIVYVHRHSKLTSLQPRVVWLYAQLFDRDRGRPSRAGRIQG